MKELGRYQNGNYTTTIYEDGTKVWETEEEDFIPEFAESIDLKISNVCNMNCPYCHEQSTPNGNQADILNEKFIDTLHPYQEIAIGGGNVLTHPDLIPFLEKLKDLKVIPNITLNQHHFETNQAIIRYLVDSKLIYGLGVSLKEPTNEFVNLISIYKNAVIHVIAGIVPVIDLYSISRLNSDLKLLILGYKDFGRGKDFLKPDFRKTIIQSHMEDLKDSIFCGNLFDWFKVVSFDNLAIEQLNIQNVLSKKQWDEFYFGDDGSHTFYIDAVERKFGLSSTTPKEERHYLLDNVDDMFNVVRQGK